MHRKSRIMVRLLLIDRKQQNSRNWLKYHDSLVSESCLLLLFKTQVQLIKKALIIFL